MDQAALGKKALDNQEYVAAVEHYTAALKSSPTSPDYYIQRSTAYQRLKRYTEALDDANHAVVNAQKRAKKESIVEAQFRRGCALYCLGRFGDAEFVLGIVKDMKDDHKMAGMWMSKTHMSLKLLADDDEKRKCTVKATPDLDVSSAASGSANGHAAGTTSTSPATGASSAPPISTPPPAPQQTPVDKIRHEWYQNPSNVYFTLLVKGVPTDKAQVDIREHSLSISFPLVTGSSYDLTLDPLFAAVDPAKSISRIFPTKMEIVLVKATPGQKWSALESSEPVAGKAESAVEGNDGQADAVKRAVFTQSRPAAPAYPTSSKSGPKDWDKITKDLRQADHVGSGEDGKTSHLDEDDDYEGGDEANHFFKKLFKDASPEVQRAMMKSYTESNGTALSTNWEEVSKGKVETSPPTGMEARKW